MVRSPDLKVKMAEDGPTKSDIEAVFKRLRAIPANKVSAEKEY